MRLFVAPLLVAVLALVLVDHLRGRATAQAATAARAVGPGTMAAPRTGGPGSRS